MPPHCDSMDGPVVLAARRALDAKDPRIVLPYVKKAGEAEVEAAFRRTIGAHDGNPTANEVADLYFFETVVRVHRAGEGVDAARAYVETMLGLEVWSHKLYGCASAGPHEEHGEAHEHAD